MRIQLVEKDPELLEKLTRRLEEAGVNVTAAVPRSEEDLAHWQPEGDLIVAGHHPLFTDLKVLARSAWPTPLIALLPTLDPCDIVQAARAGAMDVFDRSAEINQIADWIAHWCKQHEASQSTRRLSDHFYSDSCSFMQTLQSTIERVALTDSTVLIVGETGTGKELAARQVHRISPRREKPIITVNCAAIPETLIESELFGYEKGAFTGATSNRVGLIEAANGGTLFLDEIGELPLAAQARLLRFMQEGEIRRIGSVTSKQVDVRLICATHRNLAELSEHNEFRRDLFYRIDVLRLDIPPLREREGDIIAMANWFIEQQSHKLGVPAKPLSKSSLQILEEHHWPGNVRELQNLIERALVMSMGATLEITLSTGAVSDHAVHGEGGASATKLAADDRAQELSLEDYFQRFVLQHQDAMNETELAQKLGISRKCLWERRQRFGIPREKQKSA